MRVKVSRNVAILKKRVIYWRSFVVRRLTLTACTDAFQYCRFDAVISPAHCFCFRLWRLLTRCWTRPTTSTSSCRNGRQHWKLWWCLSAITVPTAHRRRPDQLSRQVAPPRPARLHRPRRQRQRSTRTFRCWRRSTALTAGMLLRSSAKSFRWHQYRHIYKPARQWQSFVSVVHSVQISDHVLV